MFSVSDLPDVLSIIIKDNSVFEQLQNDFPDILADLVSFKTNPNCSCRGRVNKYFADKLAADPTILDKYVTDPDSVANQVSEIKTARLSNNYSGKIFEIDKSPEAWEEFANRTAAGKMFRAFSIIDRGDKLVAYFI